MVSATRTRCNCTACSGGGRGQRTFTVVGKLHATFFTPLSAVIPVFCHCTPFLFSRGHTLNIVAEKIFRTIWKKFVLYQITHLFKKNVASEISNTAHVYLLRDVPHSLDHLKLPNGMDDETARQTAVAMQRDAPMIKRRKRDQFLKLAAGDTLLQLREKRTMKQRISFSMT